MAIEVLISAMAASKGHIIYEKQSPAVWGKREGPPDFIRTTITGALTVAQARAYREPWNATHDFEVINHNASLDGYRVKIFATPINTSNKGAITRAKADPYLTPYNVTFHSEPAVNDVRYDYGVYNVATSDGFWGANVAGNVDFSEYSYDQGTGEHVIDADYSATGFSEDKVNNRIGAMGGTVVSGSEGNVKFSINRTDVNTKLKAAFKEFTDGKVENRQYYVSESYVDSVISAGGTDTKSKSEFLDLIEDRLTE